MKKLNKINLFEPKFRVEECLSEIRECLECGWTGLGYKTIEFEKAWDRYTGLHGSHFVNSATAGLHLAVRLLRLKHGWPRDAEVITTPLTFVSTNHVLLYEGLKPVFVDVDRYLCLDPEQIIHAITRKTRAVMFVGFGGNTGQLKRVANICKKYDLFLILDAAHMAGTRLYGYHVGPEADSTVFSFQAVKNLPTADSGMIWFRDLELQEKVRKLSWLGIDKDTYARTNMDGTYKWKYNVNDIGYKYHGNSIMAALGIVGLKYLDIDNAYRRQLAQWYLDELQLLNIPVSMIPIPYGCESSTHIFPILTKRRDDLMAYLNSVEVYPGVHYQSNLNYSLYNSANVCDRAKKASESLISLPLHMNMTFHDVRRICAIIRKFYQ